jgi:hypothetical protein
MHKHDSSLARTNSAADSDRPSSVLPAQPKSQTHAHAPCELGVVCIPGPGVFESWLEKRIARLEALSAARSSAAASQLDTDKRRD